MGVSIFEGNKARRMTSALEVISQNIENLIAPDVAQETAVIAESKRWADGKDLAGNPVPSTSPQYQNNAKYWAEKTEESIRFGSFVEFSIDSDGYVVMEKIGTSDFDFHIDSDGYLVLDETEVVTNE